LFPVFIVPVDTLPYGELTLFAPEKFKPEILVMDKFPFFTLHFKVGQV
jgi:hypothetical protein